MKKIVIILGIISVLYSCREEANYKGKFPIINTESDDEAIISDLFESKQIIPLETTDRSLIGLGISRLDSHEGKIFILNSLSSRRNVLCFDLTGKYLFSIDRMGNGPEEYTYLGDFVIDKYKKEIILANDNNVFQVFDLDGKYIERKEARDRYFNRHLIQKDDTSFIAYNSVHSVPYSHYLLELDSDSFNIRKSVYEPLDKLGDMGDRTLSIYDNKVIYYNSNDTIYNVLSDMEQEPQYYVNLGKNTQMAKREIVGVSPETFDIEIQKQFDMGKLKIVTSIFENEKWVAISTLHYTNDFVYNTFFYNKESQITYNAENIDFCLRKNKSIKNIEIIGTLDNGAFCCLIHDELLDLDEEKIEENWIYPPGASLHIDIDEDNPILFVLK